MRIPILQNHEPETVTVDFDGESVELTSTQAAHGWGLMEAFVNEIVRRADMAKKPVKKPGGRKPGC